MPWPPPPDGGFSPCGIRAGSLNFSLCSRCPWGDCIKGPTLRSPCLAQRMEASQGRPGLGEERWGYSWNPAAVGRGWGGSVGISLHSSNPLVWRQPCLLFHRQASSGIAGSLEWRLSVSSLGPLFLGINRPVLTCGPLRSLFLQ